MPNNYVLLETIALTQSAASVTFDNLPTSGYTDLKIVISGRDSSSTGVSGGGYSFTIYPNGLSTNISQRSIFGAGSGTPGSYTDTQMYNPIEMNADTANTYSNVEIYVPNYRSSNPKSFSIDGVTENNATSAASRLAAGLWNSTAAITSLQFNAYSTWMAGSTFSLYGIAAYGTTPVLAPKATGGNIVANDGTYWYHAFTSSGYFVPQVGLTTDVLVVAGGGAGETNVVGGGGAGGVLNLTSQSLTPINYNVTVGAGAPGGNGFGYQNGVNSQFGSLTAAIGGGAGGIWTNGNGVAGGSGGGGAGYTGTGGARTVGQGNIGGNGVAAGGGFGTSGGGGGAGAAGGNASGYTPGVGGAGTSAYSAWGMATLTGQDVSGTRWYGGGGGGGGYVPNGNYGFVTGGNGGGGAGSSYDRGVNLSASSGGNGLANTGGGGGGGGSSGGYSGNGGSGIIIIRYPVN